MTADTPAATRAAGDDLVDAVGIAAWPSQATTRVPAVMSGSASILLAAFQAVEGKASVSRVSAVTLPQ